MKRQYMEGKVIQIIFEGCECQFINNGSWIGNLTEKAASVIGMTPIYGPFVKPYEDPEDVYKSGISSVLMIAESHIAIHTWPNCRAVRMTVDSCKDFYEKLLVREFQPILKPRDIYVKYFSNEVHIICRDKD